MSKPWTMDEVRVLRDHGNLGLETVSLMLGRSEQSVKQAAKRYRISLRKTGSKAGLLLGQPRSQAWTEQGGKGISPERLEVIKREVLSGVIDIALLEQRVRELASGRARDLCPSCIARPVERATTGLCEPCHLTLLAQAHRDEAHRRATRRDLDAARQEKLRSGR